MPHGARPDADPRPVVYTELVHHLDADRWGDRHRAGLVPDATPFGLGHLSASGFEVVFGPVPRSRVGRGVARRVRSRTHDVEWVESLSRAVTAQRRRADVVLCWDEFTGIPAARIAAWAGHRAAPVVSGVQMLSDDSRPDAFRRSARRSLGHARALFVQSRAMLAPLRDDWGLPEDLLHHVVFGVDTEWFRPAPDEVDRDLVVSVGDDGHRDHATLVAALAKVAADRPGSRLELATQLPVAIPSDVGVLRRGHLGPARPAFYAGAAVVCVAARPNRHGSGMSVVLEAMAAGRPYVVTAGEGLAEYVAHGVDGLVVPPGDADALAEAVLGLLNDPDRADALGRAGRRRVESGFTTRDQARAVGDLLHRVLGGKTS